MQGRNWESGRVQEQQERRNDPPRGAAASRNVETIDLVELMYRLLSSWKLIVCSAVLLALATGIYTGLFVTPMYQATSTIYVVGSSDSVINVADLNVGSALANDYLKVFKMWEVHEAVISALNLPYNYSQMQSMLSVVNDDSTRMLDITITSADPEEAANIANEYAEVVSEYIAKTMVTDTPSLMSTALTPTSPVSPNKKKRVITGFLLGALLAVGYVTVRMLMDDKYKTAEDIRKYAGLPTLAVIPVDEAFNSKGKTTVRRKS